MADPITHQRMEGMRTKPQVTSHSQRRSFARRLLISTNLAVAVILGAFMALNYHLEWKTHLREKRIALNEEAETLLAAVARVRSQGTPTLQNFIDQVCGAMQDATSPGHHIAVRMGNETLQAHAHHRASSLMLSAMEKAVNHPAGTAPVEDEVILVGSAAEGDNVIYVSEYLSTLRRIVRSQLLRSLGSIVALGVAIALVVNFMLHKLLLGPVRGMVGTVHRLGAGDLQARMPRLDTVELGVLADEFDRMAAALQTAESDRSFRMEKARRIQQNLLPDLRTLTDVKFTCVFQPAAEVAGDYYDVLTLPDGALLLCIADVTGHGVPAAMGAAMLKALLQTAADREGFPEKLLQLLNAPFCRVALAEDFATMILVRWEKRERSLTYASAGHEHAYLLRRNGESQTLTATGLPLGIDEGARWEARNLELVSGDRLVLLTDGVVEAVSAGGERFGRERLEVVLRQTMSEPLSALRDRLLDAMTTFQGSSRGRDDVTLLALEF